MMPRTDRHQLCTPTSLKMSKVQRRKKKQVTKKRRLHMPGILHKNATNRSCVPPCLRFDFLLPNMKKRSPKEVFAPVPKPQ